MKKQGKRKKNGMKNLPHQKLTFGNKAADALTTYAGSWVFIIGLLVFIAIWAYLNMVAFIQHWDPWPFILLNLFLSCLAALQAPVILMSQNRTAEIDRKRAEYDYIIDRKSQKDIQKIQKELLSIKRLLVKKKR